MPAIQKTIRDVIQERMDEKRWNLSRLSEATGIQGSNLGDMLRGKREFSLPNLILIGLVLNLKFSSKNLVLVDDDQTDESEE